LGIVLKEIEMILIYFLTFRFFYFYCEPSLSYFKLCNRWVY